MITNFRNFLTFAVGILILSLFGCSSQQGNAIQKKNNDTLPIPSQPYVTRNKTTVPGQVLPPHFIRSITFYKINDPGGAPIIRLHSDDRLELQFDDMSNDANMFTVRITHYNEDWQRSYLNPVNYSSNLDDQISNGIISKANNPSYTHYTYTFPNKNLKPLVSGNYLLQVYNFSTGKELFSLPFFVTEQRREVTTHIETLFNEGKYMRYNQLFATYPYPDFIEFPRLDLSVIFVQNQFWGRARKAQIKDLSEPGVIKFHDSREDLFAATYEFRQLNLNPLNGESYRVLSFQPGEVPPKVVLRRDVVNLDNNPPQRATYKFGIPDNSRYSEYADVHFSLEVPSSYHVSGPIYIYGSFNNWTIREANKMHWDQQTAMYKGQAFIKQGDYEYKYAMVKDGKVDDLSLDASFANTKQQYYTFVYFKDPEMHYDRLLAYNLTYSGSF